MTTNCLSRIHNAFYPKKKESGADAFILKSNSAKGKDAPAVVVLQPSEDASGAFSEDRSEFLSALHDLHYLLYHPFLPPDPQVKEDFKRVWSQFSGNQAESFEAAYDSLKRFNREDLLHRQGLSDQEIFAETMFLASFPNYHAKLRLGTYFEQGFGVKRSYQDAKICYENAGTDGGLLEARQALVALRKRERCNFFGAW